MRLFTRISTLLILLFAFTLVAQAEGAKTIAVAGFVNQGNKTEDSVNKVISKSLITFLKKVKGTKVTSFEVIENLAEENKLWASKTLDTNKVVDMGLNLAVQQVVAGTYKVDKSKDTIKITVYVFDPAMSELKLKRDYNGDAGIDIFDTIDRLIRNIIHGTGRTRDHNGSA